MKPFNLFALVLLLPLLLWMCAEPPKNPEKKDHPNVILILADDQGWGDLSYNGNTNLSTPNIDALAVNGLVFENFYVQPVCSPTRAELLTGRYATRMGIYATSSGGERMNLNETTIAEVFKAAGYITALYGKWHNGTQPPYHPNSRGFDDFYGFCSGHWGNYFSPMLEQNGAIVGGRGFLPNDLFDRGIAFIKSNQNNPFFLAIPVNTPHSPMQVPDEHWNMFRDKELTMKSRREEIEDENFTRAALSMVENIDWNVGRLMEELKESGLEENTIVIYLSDNGPNGYRWNGDMKGIKGSTDEGGVRSPCFVHWPKRIESGRKIHKIAGAIDLLPTLTAMAGIRYPENLNLDGKDLTPIIFDADADWQSRPIFHHWGGRTSLRTQDYRLDHENKLFNMTTDPGQKQDVSKSHPKLTDSLIKIKEHWLSTIIDQNTKSDSRAFTVGHPKSEYTHLPARDAVPHGNIKRSNKYPNDSFLYNWTSTKDSITWDVEVLENGVFEVELYYTCKPENKGVQIKLSLGENEVFHSIDKPHDPPLTGMENDRSPRIESYVKDFIPVKMGTIELRKGKGTLALTAPKITGSEAIDFRLLLLKRL